MGRDLDDKICLGLMGLHLSFYQQSPYQQSSLLTSILNL